jgi:hypothetical protein
LQSYLSTLDLSNLTGLVEAVEYMRELGIAEEDIKAFWDSAVNGVSTYAKTLSEVLALMKRFQTSGTDV